MISRKFWGEVEEDGNVMIKLAGETGIVRPVDIGWEAMADDWQETFQNQYEAYGALLAKLFELST